MKTKYISLGLLFIGIIAFAIFANQPARERTFSSATLPPLSSTTPVFTLTSAEFKDDGMLPRKYTCDAGNAEPPELLISSAPEGTKSFILIVEDPDIPDAIKQKNNLDTFVHWVFYNIPGDTTAIRRGTTPGEWGITSANGTDYIPPCPPSEYNPNEHRYVFSLYALNNTISLGSAASAPQLRTLMSPYLLAEARIVGRYSRK